MAPTQFVSPAAGREFLYHAHELARAFTPPRLQPAQPNNRIQWFYPAFITPFTCKPDYLATTRIWKVERETETTQTYVHDPVGAVPRHAQVQLHAKGRRSDSPTLPET
jgi:hypothetical protein